jgi:hypothetical protein
VMAVEAASSGVEHVTAPGFALVLTGS